MLLIIYNLLDQIYANIIKLIIFWVLFTIAAS